MYRRVNNNLSTTHRTNHTPTTHLKELSQHPQHVEGQLRINANRKQNARQYQYTDEGLPTTQQDHRPRTLCCFDLRCERGHSHRRYSSDQSASNTFLNLGTETNCHTDRVTYPDMVCDQINIPLNPITVIGHIFKSYEYKLVDGKVPGSARTQQVNQTGERHRSIVSQTPPHRSHRSNW